MPKPILVGYDASRRDRAPLEVGRCDGPDGRSADRRDGPPQRGAPRTWDVGGPGHVRVEGAHSRVVGAKRGPEPAHDIPIEVGLYEPRGLRLPRRPPAVTRARRPSRPRLGIGFELGLAIDRDMMRRMGGDLVVLHPARPIGSRFRAVVQRHGYGPRMAHPTGRSTTGRPAPAASQPVVGPLALVS